LRGFLLCSRPGVSAPNPGDAQRAQHHTGVARVVLGANIVAEPLKTETKTENGEVLNPEVILTLPSVSPPATAPLLERQGRHLNLTP
jgi:hypothetical protein